jgi:hypothetical protein
MAMATKVSLGCEVVIYINVVCSCTAASIWEHPTSQLMYNPVVAASNALLPCKAVYD